MFAKATIQPGEKWHLYDISRYFKIWFSLDPDEFLGLENQLRFVRMRHDNPEATLFFIYSQKSLSTTANKALMQFCEQYSIIAIEFDDIEPMLSDEKDKIIYALAQEELLHALNNTGGNIASVADLVRLLVPVIEKYGIYTDFDVHTRLTQLGSNYITLRGPLLFNAEYMKINSNDLLLIPNSDFLMFSINDTDYTVLSEEALIAIRNVQSAIIENYKRPFIWQKVMANYPIEESEEYPKLQKIFNEFFQKHTQNPSIFDFRLYLSTLPESQKINDKHESPKSFLTRCSVINISGPGNLQLFFKQLIPSHCQHMPTFVPFEKNEWAAYLNLYERCIIGFYDPIYDCIDTKNRVSSAQTIKKNETGHDNSWTESGRISQKERNVELLNAGLVLQKACRKHRLWKEHPYDSLVFKIRKICIKESSLSPKIDKNYASLLSALIEKNFPLVLRRACSGLKLSIITVLLEYKQIRGIEFDLNEPSPSTGNTALNLVLEAKPSTKLGKENQKVLVEMLKNAGALASSQMNSSNVC